MRDVVLSAPDAEEGSNFDDADCCRLAFEFYGCLEQRARSLHKKDVGRLACAGLRME